jgi:hypothetical protein
MGLVKEDQQFSVMLDHFGVSGLHLLDDKSGLENASKVKHASALFPKGQPRTARFFVHNGGVKVVVEGETIIDWTGESERLSNPLTWDIGNPEILYLASNGPHWRFESLRLLPLTDQPAASVPKDGLVAHWKFDEGQGDVARDATGGQHGKRSGAAWIKGLHGGALSFDGKDDFVFIGNPEALNFEGPITITAWIRPRSVAPTEKGEVVRNIVAHGWADYAPGEMCLRINVGASAPSYNVRAQFEQKGSGGALAAIPREDLGAWVHLVGAYDGEFWRLYRNGVLAAEAKSPVGAIRTKSKWVIGAREGNDRNFAGDIDDVRIYNRALSADEVAILAKRDVHVGKLPDTGGASGEVANVHPVLGYALKPHPADAVEFNGHWYKQIKGAPTWIEAYNACKEMGGHLICVETKEEAKLLTTYHHCWLGGVKRDSQWMWLNGAAMDFKSICRSDFRKFRKNFANYGSQTADRRI